MKNYIPKIKFNPKEKPKILHLDSIRPTGPFGPQKIKSILSFMGAQDMIWNGVTLWERNELTHFDIACLHFFYQVLDHSSDYEEVLLESLKNENNPFSQRGKSETYQAVVDELLIDPITGIRRFQFGNYLSRYLSHTVFRQINDKDVSSFLQEGKNRKRNFTTHYFESYNNCDEYHTKISDEESLFLIELFRKRFNYKSTYLQELMVGLELQERPNLYRKNLNLYANATQAIIQNGMTQKLNQNKGPKL
ncbi:hypothetical protein [Mesonia maritima]|uniref:Uncharacterized protein n=1 Tax=Mesonia maritima TaxID=1793873 RepID=A0ABU1K1D5_9FLAO|nr:hypothetical protein [Mesonia maritima]MDR6299420.1 hypothetical protein [Mesonia maritima]